MQNWKKVTIAGAGLAMAAGAALVLPGLGGMAADHLDPPARTDPSVDSTPDRAADIADGPEGPPMGGTANTRASLSTTSASA